MAAIQSEPVEIQFDEGRHPRAKIGFLLLATEQTVQDDVLRISPPGVGIHFTRVPNADSITRDSLKAIGPELTRAAATLLPDGSLDLVSYACTSGSLVLGEEHVHSLLNKGAPGAIASCIISSVISALNAVHAKRIVVATPYLDEVNTDEYHYLVNAGFDVLNIQGLNLERDSDMVRVSPQFILEFAASLDQPEADALFISCGALRSLDIISALEQRCGKPVITSNQAMIWRALRLVGIDDPISGFGRLLSEC